MNYWYKYKWYWRLKSKRKKKTSWFNNVNVIPPLRWIVYHLCWLSCSILILNVTKCFRWNRLQVASGDNSQLCLCMLSLAAGSLLKILKEKENCWGSKYREALPVLRISVFPVFNCEHFLHCDLSSCILIRLLLTQNMFRLPRHAEKGIGSWWKWEML